MNFELPPPVMAAFVGAFVAGAFSVLSFFLIRRKEETTREYEAAARYLERQIEELYGPLLNLIQTNKAVYDIASSRLKGPGGVFDFEQFADEEWKLWNFLNGTYLIPTNREIARLLRDKSFLIDYFDRPQSIEQFGVHAIQYELVNSIWQATGVDAKFIDHVRFPKELRRDVQNRLLELREQHARLLNQVGAKRFRQG